MQPAQQEALNAGNRIRVLLNSNNYNVVHVGIFDTDTNTLEGPELQEIHYDAIDSELQNLLGTKELLVLK